MIAIAGRGTNASVIAVYKSAVLLLPIAAVSLGSDAVYSATPAVAAGGARSFLLRSDGTVFGWGATEGGYVYTPVQIDSSFFPMTAISTSGSNSVAICTGGKLCVWGDNERGALGTGTRYSKAVPVQLSTITPSSIASGSLYTVIVKNDGTVSAWGLNHLGQLGYGTPGLDYSYDILTPQTVPGLTGVVSVAAGDSHTLALLADGTVWSWGLNNFGQLGKGTTVDAVTPAQVSGLTDIQAISAAGTSSMALRNDGTVWIWGAFLPSPGIYMPSDPIKSVPQQVPGLNGVQRISVGTTHALALNADGSVWAWGVNTDGAVGDGTKSPRPSPVQVLTGASAIATGGNHSLAIGNNGAVWSWGSNFQGALGVGSGVNEILSPSALPLYTAAPSNDNFANRQTISGVTGSIGSTLFGATQEAGEPAPPTSSVSVWYRWTAPSTGQVTLTTSGASTTTVAAYSGTVVGSLTHLGDNVFQVQGGQEYSIALYGAPTVGTTTLTWSLIVGASADIQMSVTAPPSPSYQDDGLEFIVSVFNAGPNAAANVVVTDVLPSDTAANQSSLPNNCMDNATTVSCSMGTINVNQTKTVSISLHSLLAPQIVSNAINVSTATPDPMTSNNSSTSVVNVLPGGTTGSDDGDVPTVPQWALILLSILLFGQVISRRSVVSMGKLN